MISVKSLMCICRHFGTLCIGVACLGAFSYIHLMQAREQFNFTVESEDLHSIMTATHMMKGSPQAMAVYMLGLWEFMHRKWLILQCVSYTNQFKVNSPRRMNPLLAPVSRVAAAGLPIARVTVTLPATPERTQRDE